MGYEPTPIHRPPAVIRAFVPTLPGLWGSIAAEQIRTLPPMLPVLLLSHHMTPLVVPPWDEFAHLFFGTVAPWYVNLVFDDRDPQTFVAPKLGVAADGETAPWLPETTRPALVKFWTADVPNVLFTRPQGRALSVDERDQLFRYDAVVTDLADSIPAMEKMLNQRVCGSLGEALTTLARDLLTKEF